MSNGQLLLLCGQLLLSAVPVISCGSRSGLLGTAAGSAARRTDSGGLGGELFDVAAKDPLKDDDDPAEPEHADQVGRGWSCRGRRRETQQRECELSSSALRSLRKARKRLLRSDGSSGGGVPLSVASQGLRA